MSNAKNIDIISKEIVYGTVAFWLGKKAEETVSHKWCVYVRGPNNEDISYFIKSVVFTLHNSFVDHERVVDKFPFDLYESGWGEFDIKITINLKDELINKNMPPIEFIHFLKLYPTLQHVNLSTKKPIVSENFDEIVFVNPNKIMKQILNNVPAKNNFTNIIIPNITNLAEEEEKSIAFSNNVCIQNENDPIITNTFTNTFTNNFNNIDISSNMNIDHNLGSLNYNNLENANTISNTFNNQFNNIQINATQDVEMKADDLQGNNESISLYSADKANNNLKNETSSTVNS